MPFSSKYTRQNLVQKLPVRRCPAPCYWSSLTGLQRLPHRALAIADILHNIFKHAVPIGWDWTDEAHDEYRYDLLRFALCCRAFAAPALDVLWQHMPSIDPLLHLLPLRQVDETWVRLLCIKYDWFRVLTLICRSDRSQSTMPSRGECSACMRDG